MGDDAGDASEDEPGVDQGSWGRARDGGATEGFGTPPSDQTTSESGWLPYTAPPAVPPPPPPPRSRRGLVILMAVLLVLVGAGVAIGLALNASKGSPAAGPTAAPSPSLMPPAGLTASAEPFAITLSWSQPPGGSSIENYAIYRNDSLLDQVPRGSTSYEDDGVTPGKRYTYKVQAMGGNLTTDYVTVVVRAPKPPVSEARVEGDFNVKFTFTSSSGFTSVTKGFTAGWHFEPKCGTGACKVTWSDITEKSLKAVLKRSGAKYSGKDTGTFFATCGSHKVDSDVTLSFKVAKAKGLESDWRATRIEGTVTHYASAQLGCVSSRATLAIVGTLLG